MMRGLKAFLALALLWLVSVPAYGQQVGTGCTPIGRGATTGFFSDCMVSVPGSANAIILTPTFGQTPITSTLAKYTTYRFQAVATTTATTTIRLGTSGPGPYRVYTNGSAGVVEAKGGEIVNGNWYAVTFDPLLNTNLGGWVITSGSMGANNFTDLLRATQSDTFSTAKNPFVSFSRTVNNAASPYPPGTVGRTMDIINSVYGNVGQFEYGVAIQAIQNSQITTAQDISALNATGVRSLGALGSVNGVWGGNILAIDDTARKSSLTPEYLRGLEVNTSGSGPDDANLRIGIDVIQFERSTSTDGATSHYAGVRVIPASAFGTNHGQAAVTIKNGFAVDRFGTSGIGDIQVGFGGNASLVNFISQGAAPSVAAFYANHTLSSAWNALVVGPVGSPGAVFRGDGTVFLTPLAGSSSGLSSSFSGLTANSQIGAALNYNKFVIAGEQSNTSDAAFATNGLLVSLTTGGSNSHGARQAIEGIVARTAASAAGNGNRNDVGVTGRCLPTSADNGTNTGAGAAGACFGGNFVAELGASATNYLELAGAEVNVGMQAGGSAKYRFGWSVVGYGLGQGASLDAAFEVGNLAASVIWQNAMLLSSIHGAAPIATTGCVICTDGTAQTIATGLDLGAYTISGNFLNGPGGLFKVTGAGAATAISYGIGASTIIGVSGSNIFVASPDGVAKAFFGSAGNATLFRNSTGTSFQDTTGASTYASILATGATFISYVQSGITTVGSLPTCNAGAKAARHFVTDSNAVSYTAGIGSVVAAGGSTNVPVICDGTNWRVG